MGRDGRGWKRASASSYEVTFIYRGQRCRERVKGKPSPANDRRVEQFRFAVLQAIEDGSFNYATTFPDSPRAREFCATPGDTLTVKALLEQWLATMRDELKSSALDGYSKIIRNHLIPAFGAKNIADLSRRDVKEWVKGLDVSAKTTRNRLAPLRAMLDEAVDDELIPANPLTDLKIRSRDGRRARARPIDPFTTDELEAIRVAAGSDWNMIEFWVWTGLRPSELIALDWPDIDWIGGKAHIWKALTQAADDPEEPKTEAGERFVDLLPPALAALKRQRLLTGFRGEEIFQDPRHHARWAGDHPIRELWWRPLLRRAKVRYRKPYHLRHTYASRMLSAGENVMWVAQQMGHKNWYITAKHYARWIPTKDDMGGSKALSKFGANDNITPTSTTK